MGQLYDFFLVTRCTLAQLIITVVPRTEIMAIPEFSSVSYPHKVFAFL